MMVELFGKYFILSQRSKCNIFLFEIILLILVVIKTYRDKKIMRNVACYILFSVIFWILVSTVLARIHWEIWNVVPINPSRIKWVPFYSYFVIASGNKAYLQQVLMNCCMLFPVGFLLPYVYKNLKQSSCVKICFYLSAGIECFQLIYNCGLCEFDDIIHSVFGGFCGTVCFNLFYKIMLLYKTKFLRESRNFVKTKS